MYLVIDIGNTRAKVVVMQNNSVVYSTIVESVTMEMVDDMLLRYPDVTYGIVSSTRDNSAQICEMLSERLSYVLDFKPASTPIPIANRYQTPQTLGADRLAAAVGVWAMYPDRDVMIVDFGTAITIDYVVGGAYLGGNISPGVTTRFRALADYTASLPKCCPTDEILEYGRTTVEAIEQGVMRGVEHEIRGYVEAFSKENDRKCIIFTGGDAKYFVKRIKNTIFADCEPVVYGLSRILEYNAEKI